jgi:CRP-like cAMP-binding protein
MLNRDTAFCEDFLTFLLARNARIQDDLADRIFNSAEKRLARVLLLLGNGKNGNGIIFVPKISQEVLATMIGATRPRVNMLMNRFKRLGVIRYGRELQINSSLLHGLLLE